MKLCVIPSPLHQLPDVADSHYRGIIYLFYNRAKVGAQALVHAGELSRNVTTDAHRRVLELQRLKYRGFFHETLSDKSSSFYYGVDAKLELSEAAKASSAPSEHAGRRVTSQVQELSPKSLYAIWQAAQWPTDYNDPLDRDFDEKEQGRLTVLFPGLYEYLQHRKQYASASGKLFPRNKGEIV